jgi:hypothetical protein
MGKELGEMSNDLDKPHKDIIGCKIIRGIWISPKLYMLEYIDKNMKIHRHFRGKGVQNDKLGVEIFDKMLKDESVKIHYTKQDKPQFKKFRFNLNNTDIEKGIERLSIYRRQKQDKILNRTLWGGRLFLSQTCSVPHGYLNKIK